MSERSTWFSVLRRRGRASITRTWRGWSPVRILDVIGGIMMVVVLKYSMKRYISFLLNGPYRDLYLFINDCANSK